MIFCKPSHFVSTYLADNLPMQPGMFVLVQAALEAINAEENAQARRQADKPKTYKPMLGVTATMFAKSCKLAAHRQFTGWQPQNMTKPEWEIPRILGKAVHTVYEGVLAEWGRFVASERKFIDGATPQQEKRMRDHKFSTWSQYDICLTVNEAKANLELKTVDSDTFNKFRIAFNSNGFAKGDFTQIRYMEYIRQQLVTCWALDFSQSFLLIVNRDNPTEYIERVLSYDVHAHAPGIEGRLADIVSGTIAERDKCDHNSPICGYCNGRAMPPAESPQLSLF